MEIGGKILIGLWLLKCLLLPDLNIDIILEIFSLSGTKPEASD